jgi:hypothetical protein
VISLFKGSLSKGASSLLLIGSAIAFNAQMSEFILYSPLVPQALLGLAFTWFGFSLLKNTQTTTYDEINVENDENEIEKEVEDQVDYSTLEQKSSNEVETTTSLPDMELNKEDDAGEETPHSIEGSSIEHKQEVSPSS